MALLQVQGVSLDHVDGPRRVRAAHRVDFALQSGERLVLLGPSGCGKSSLLKAVAGFIPPSEGRILLDGQPVTGPGPDRLVVFQEFDQLLAWKTVHANVMFPLLATRRARADEAAKRADDALAAVGLAGFAAAYPHTLSGGMKQRVALARALVMRPRVLLMDEPFAALDALTRLRMQRELLALAERFGLTLLFVTHSVEEALLVGHRIVLLSAHPGRVQATFDARDFDLQHQGSPRFQQAVQHIHAQLLQPDQVEAA